MPTLKALLLPASHTAASYSTSALIPTLALCVLRLLLSLYAFLVSILLLALSRADAGASFSYFTVLTYWGLAFYLAFAGAHSLSARRVARTTTDASPWLARWAWGWRAAHAVLYSTVIVYPFLVTVVFWAVLYRGEGFPDALSTWSNVSCILLPSSPFILPAR